VALCFNPFVECRTLLANVALSHPNQLEAPSRWAIEQRGHPSFCCKDGCPDFPSVTNPIPFLHLALNHGIASPQEFVPEKSIQIGKMDAPHLQSPIPCKHRFSPENISHSSRFS
jgi:hypothetical protein